MPICRKCSETFPAGRWVDGKRQSFQNRKYCLICSPYKKHNTRKLEENKDKKDRICINCQKQYKYDRSKGHRKNICNSCWGTKRRKTLKKRMTDYKGGKCIRCGYDKCLSAMEFHHRDRQTKEFTISFAHCLSWQRISVELDKCDLLCANCHRETEEIKLGAPGIEPDPRD